MNNATDKKQLSFLASALVLWVTAVLLLSACAANDQPANREIVVFAASSLTDAFNELGAAFEAEHPGVEVVLNFAGSSQLAAQLVEGVPADVFAPANDKQMQTAVTAKRIAPTAPVTFATNRLTILTPADNPTQISALEDLRRPGIQLVLAAPGVPVRQYTDEIVSALGPEFAAGFYANLVSEEENVRQVAAKIALGEADAGIVYTSDVTPDLANRVQQIAIPEAQNVVAVYPIAPLADAPQPELAQQFVQFVLGETGQAILARWGFASPE